ncbi:MAG: pyridoxal phosphate-dependent aminotransferase [Streptosporangiaceae bacterium]|jgi:N-succinyldiaminopimelate aminotransferase
MSAGAGPPTRDAGFSCAARVGQLPRGGLVALLREGRARGDVVDLAVGTPSAPATPGALIEGACAALRAGVNQYADPAGDPELRAGLARLLAVPADPDTEITVTVGASEALALALLATVNPGDEVIVLEPFYENFIGAVALAGGQPRFVRMHPPRWRFDENELAPMFGPHTRAIIVNTPGNPTGRVLDQGEFAVIARLCDRWNVTVISDETYAALTFDGQDHLSAAAVPGLAQRCIVIGSLSKSHAVSGWRLGFAWAEPRRTEAIRALHMATTSGAAAPLQRAAATSGALGAAGREPARQLQELRNLTVEILSGMGLACTAAEGGCYIMADIRPVTSEDSEAYAHRLMTEAGVLVTPGTLFFDDPPAGRPYIRVAFNRPRGTLEVAGRRLARYSTTPIPARFRADGPRAQA